jgi:ATP-binding cassette subfamily B protein
MGQSGYTDRVLYRRMLAQARPYWPHIACLFLLSLVSTPLALLTPLPLKLAVDNVIGSEPLPRFLDRLIPPAIAGSDAAMLLFAAAMLVGLALIGQLHGLLVMLLSSYAGNKLALSFRARLFAHVQRLSLSYLDSKGTADSVFRIQWDSAAIRYIAIDGVIPFITAGLTFISMLFVTFRIDWQLALVALSVSPFLFMLIRLYGGSLRQQSRAVKQLESQALGVIQEVLGSLRVVKAFGQEDREHARFVRQSNEGMRARIRLYSIEGWLGVLLSGTTAVGTAAVLYIGVLHVSSGILTLGTLLLVMGYLSQLYGPLHTISKTLGGLQGHFASAERAFALLDEVPDVVEHPHPRRLGRAAGAIELRNLSFAYNGGPPVLRDISLAIPAGTRIGIAGKTGAGKTTLMGLLVRFYDPSGGEILLDGIDLRDYKIADLRRQFAIVLQEPVLFSTTIAENIAYARPDASEADIVKAATAANAHEFIQNLEDGYNTKVGERGMRLSGGERQRISLARAFLTDAPILILDEPTSSVDVMTEAGIIEALEKLMHGRTTFMVAHRLTTLKSCDLLLRVEGGRIVDRTEPIEKTIRTELLTSLRDTPH